MIRRSLFIALGLMIVLSTLSVAQETKRVLLLPVDIRGSRESLTSDEVTAYLESAVESEAPGVDVVLPTQVMEASESPPSVEDARALAKEYNANSVVWLTVRFRDQSLPTASEYTRNLTLSAAARLWIYGDVSDRVIVDEPVSVVRQTPLSSSVGVATQAAAMRDLKFSCGTELASSLVHAALDARNRRMVGSWNEPKAPEAAASGNYQHFLRAFSAYQTAVAESDFVAAAGAQTEARQAWADLAESDRAKAEAQYPGLQKWIGQ
jgi:hypothetical protein